MRLTTPPAAPERAAAPVGPVTSKALPEVRAVAPPAVMLRPSPVVRAEADKLAKVPAVVELAVTLTKPPVPE